METFSLNDFFAKTMGGRPNQMDMRTYFGHAFQCSCGKMHDFNENVSVIRELPGMKLVFECPDDQSFITCIKVKGWFRFKGFKALFGAKQDDEMNVEETLKDGFEKKYGTGLE